MATKSRSALYFLAARRIRRPIRPKPLIATRVFAIVRYSVSSGHRTHRGCAGEGHECYGMRSGPGEYAGAFAGGSPGGQDVVHEQHVSPTQTANGLGHGAKRTGDVSP